MEVASDQMGELDKEGVNERARGVSQDDGLLLCKRKVYPLCETVGKENQAAVTGAIKVTNLKRNYATHKRRFMSSGEIPDSE